MRVPHAVVGDPDDALALAERPVQVDLDERGAVAREPSVISIREVLKPFARERPQVPSAVSARALPDHAE